MTCSFGWCAASNHFHCRNDPPESMRAEPSMEEVFAVLRHQVVRLRRKRDWISTNDEHALDAALALLERRMCESPPLAVLVEAFCRDVEAAAASRSTRGRGGQHVPCHNGLGNLPPSAASALGRWARDFRECLERNERAGSKPCWCSSPDAGDCPRHPGSK
jgi:hypothetical protein